MVSSMRDEYDSQLNLLSDLNRVEASIKNETGTLTSHLAGSRREPAALIFLPPDLYVDSN